MAIKKEEKTVKTEKITNDMSEQEKNDSESNNVEEAEKATKVVDEQKEEEVKLAYIGPTLPAGQLKCNKIFIGTVSEIKEELKTILEKYPLVEKMLVPADKMGEKKDKARTAGNILHKYYIDLASGITANAVKEG